MIKMEYREKLLISTRLEVVLRHQTLNKCIKNCNNECYKNNQKKAATHLHKHDNTTVLPRSKSLPIEPSPQATPQQLQVAATTTIGKKDKIITVDDSGKLEVLKNKFKQKQPDKKEPKKPSGEGRKFYDDKVLELKGEAKKNADAAWQKSAAKVSRNEGGGGSHSKWHK